MIFFSKIFHLFLGIFPPCKHLSQSLHMILSASFSRDFKKVSIKSLRSSSPASATTYLLQCAQCGLKSEKRAIYRSHHIIIFLRMWGKIKNFQTTCSINISCFTIFPFLEHSRSSREEAPRGSEWMDLKMTFCT